MPNVIEIIKISQEINSECQKDWKELNFFALHTEGSPFDCFSISDIADRVIDAFIDINKILSSHRAEFDGSSKWTVFTMSVSKDGQFDTDFDYSDHSEDAISVERNWKRKFL